MSTTDHCTVNWPVATDKDPYFDALVATGTFAFIPPGVPHNLAKASDKPPRMLLTISPPGQERYFEELEKLVAPRMPMPLRN